jgi:deoxyribose-phosphate aldolase
MYIDFALTDTDINDAQAKETIITINKYNIINSITLPFYLLKIVKNLIDTNNVHLSCFIDYPLGVSDLKTRRFAVEQAAKAGATAVDMAMPQNLASNRKYEKIRDDIRSVVEFCQENSIEPRYILEYRMFDHHCLKKICEIFDSLNIKHVYPSTGFFIDNLADNILASIFLHQNSKDLRILCTGNTWTKKHFETIKKSGLYGFRTTSLHSMKNFIESDFSDNDKSGV